MKAAIYARVSTDEQHPEMQKDALLKSVEVRGLKVYAYYQDTISSRERNRPELDNLMRDARAGKFGMVMVWKFDRFARSTQELLAALEEFRSLGIEFVSITEGIDTTTTVGKMVFTIIGAIAEFERDLIRERVKAGLAHARATGKRIGRPRAVADAAEIIRLRAENPPVTWREIGRRLHISPATALEKAKGELLNKRAEDATRLSDELRETFINPPIDGGAKPMITEKRKKRQKDVCKTVGS